MIIEDIENLAKNIRTDNYHGNHNDECVHCNFLHQSIPYLLDIAKQCRALAHNFQEFPTKENPILVHKILDSVEKLEHFEFEQP